MRRMPTGKELKALENLSELIEPIEWGGLKFNIPDSDGSFITMDSSTPEPPGSALGFDNKWFFYVKELNTFSFGYAQGKTADTVLQLCDITFDKAAGEYTISFDTADIVITSYFHRKAPNGFIGDRFIASGNDAKFVMGYSLDYYGGEFGIVPSYDGSGVFLGVQADGTVTMWATENNGDGSIDNCTFIILQTTTESHIQLGTPGSDAYLVEYTPLDQVNGYDFTTSPAGNADLECRKYGSTNPNLQVCDSIVANLNLTAELGMGTSGQITLTQASGESVAGLEFTGVLLKEHTLVGACYLYGTGANTFVLYYQNATGQDLPAGSYRANLTKLKAN